MQNEVHNETVCAARKDSDYSFTAVPSDARKGILSLLAVMVGFSFTSSSMVTGAQMGLNSDLLNFIYALLLGGIFLSIYTGILAYIGGRTGLSFDLLCRRAFGRFGSMLPSLLLTLTQIGWFGVCSAMLAIPVAEYLGCSVYPVLAVACMFMIYTAYIGFKGLEILSYIAVPMILVLGGWSVWHAICSGSQSFVETFNASTGENDLNMLIGLVIGSFISGGTTTPNFTRFARTARFAVISTVTAFMIGNSIMILFGAVGANYAGKDDVFYIMMSQGLVLSAFVVLGANIWTTNDNALYSVGLSLANIFSIRKKLMVLAGGFAGTVCALWLYHNFISWLQFLGATLPAIGIILILDYFCSPDKYTHSETGSNFSWAAIAGTVCGMLAGNFLEFGCGGINSMIAAAAVWAVMSRVKKSLKA